MPSNSLPFLASIRSLPRAAWILFFGTFLNRFGTFVMPFLVLYLIRRGYSIGQAGAAVGTYGVGHLAASFLGGHLADRLGRRQTIMLSMFSSAGSMLLLSQADRLPAIFALTFLAGLCAELYRPASSALLTDLCPPGQQATAWALYRLAINLGFAAGPATAGFLSQRSFFLLFAGDAATSVLFGLVAWLALPIIEGHPRVKEESITQGYAAVLGDRRFVAFLIASLGVVLVDFQMGAALPLHVQRAGFSGATYGNLIAINGILIVLFELAVTAVTRRLPPRWMLALGFLLSGCGFALTGVSFTVPALAATVVIWTFGEMISSPMAGTYISSLAPSHLRGRYMGLWSATWSIGMMLGPWLGALIFAKNPTLLWDLCGGLGALSALLVLLAMGGPRRP